MNLSNDKMKFLRNLLINQTLLNDFTIIAEKSLETKTLDGVYFVSIKCIFVLIKDLH